MSNYQTLYSKLFNAITESLKTLERMDYGTTKKLLIEAQQQCEELYIQSEDDETDPGET